jgi:hypothetical protein
MCIVFRLYCHLCIVFSLYCHLCIVFNLFVNVICVNFSNKDSLFSLTYDISLFSISLVWVLSLWLCSVWLCLNNLMVCDMWNVIFSLFRCYFDYIYICYGRLNGYPIPIQNPTRMGMNTIFYPWVWINFYPQHFYWRMSNYSTWPKSDPLSSLVGQRQSRRGRQTRVRMHDTGLEWSHTWLTGRLLAW